MYFNNVSMLQQCLNSALINVSMYEERSNFFLHFKSCYVFLQMGNKNCLGAEDGRMRITKIHVLQLDYEEMRFSEPHTLKHDDDNEDCEKK